MKRTFPNNIFVDKCFFIAAIEKLKNRKIIVNWLLYSLHLNQWTATDSQWLFTDASSYESFTENQWNSTDESVK